jgi:hypothetical protein
MNTEELTFSSPEIKSTPDELKNLTFLEYMREPRCSEDSTTVESKNTTATTSGYNSKELNQIIENFSRCINNAKLSALKECDTPRPTFNWVNNLGKILVKKVEVDGYVCDENSLKNDSDTSTDNDASIVTDVVVQTNTETCTTTETSESENTSNSESDSENKKDTEDKNDTEDTESEPENEFVYTLVHDGNPVCYSYSKDEIYKMINFYKVCLFLTSPDNDVKTEWNEQESTLTVYNRYRNFIFSYYSPVTVFKIVKVQSANSILI